MAITITPKYKPFTYDELVKPLEEYWDKYDQEEAKLQDELNNLAKLKAIVDTAPEDNVDRQKFDKLYQDFQNSVNLLADKGLSIDNKNLFRILRQEFNAQVPRILMAEEDARKAKQEFMKLQNSGKYIVPNNNNPGSFTWTNYLDGNIPAFDPALLKQEVFLNAAQQAETITKRVTHNPEVNNNALPGYSSITQKQGLKFDSIDDMMQNEIMQNIYNTIRQSYNTEGWDEASITALENEIKTGMARGTFYNEKTDYQKHPTSSSNSPTTMGEKLQKALDNIRVKNISDAAQRQSAGTDRTPNGHFIAVSPDQLATVVIHRDDETIRVPYKPGQEKESDEEVAARYEIENDLVGESSWTYGDGKWNRTYKNTLGVEEITLPGTLKDVQLSSEEANNANYTRVYAPYHNEVIKGAFDNYANPTAHELFKTYDPQQFIVFVRGKMNKDSDASRYLLPIHGIMRHLATQNPSSFDNFIEALGILPRDVARSYLDDQENSQVVANFNNAIWDTFQSNYLPTILMSAMKKAATQLQSDKGGKVDLENYIDVRNYLETNDPKKSYLSTALLQMEKDILTNILNITKSHTLRNTFEHDFKNLNLQYGIKEEESESALNQSTDVDWTVKAMSEALAKGEGN